VFLLSAELRTRIGLGKIQRKYTLGWAEDVSHLWLQGSGHERGGASTKNGEDHLSVPEIRGIVRRNHRLRWAYGQLRLSGSKYLGCDAAVHLGGLAVNG
jgi:hypothetical protein